MSFPIPTNQSTSAVCGDFANPVSPDQGQTFPLPVKLTCERPDAPVIECSDDQYVTEYNPSTGGFMVSSRLFDEDCGVITDQSGQPILTIIT